MYFVYYSYAILISVLFSVNEREEAPDVLLAVKVIYVTATVRGKKLFVFTIYAIFLSGQVLVFIFYSQKKVIKIFFFFTLTFIHFFLLLSFCFVIIILLYTSQ